MLILFFADFTAYWRREKLHLAPHAPKNLYKFLADFIQINDRFVNKDVIYEILKFDALMSDNGKFRPEFLPWQELSKQVIDDFYMGEQAQKYIKNYQFNLGVI